MNGGTLRQLPGCNGSCQYVPGPPLFHARSSAVYCSVSILYAKRGCRLVPSVQPAPCRSDRPRFHLSTTTPHSFRVSFPGPRRRQCRSHRTAGSLTTTTTDKGARHPLLLQARGTEQSELANRTHLFRLRNHESKFPSDTRTTCASPTEPPSFLPFPSPPLLGTLDISARFLGTCV